MLPPGFSGVSHKSAEKCRFDQKVTLLQKVQNVPLTIRPSENNLLHLTLLPCFKPVLHKTAESAETIFNSVSHKTAEKCKTSLSGLYKLACFQAGMTLFCSFYHFLLKVQKCLFLTFLIPLPAGVTRAVLSSTRRCYPGRHTTHCCYPGRHTTHCCYPGRHTTRCCYPGSRRPTDVTRAAGDLQMLPGQDIHPLLLPGQDIHPLVLPGPAVPQQVLPGPAVPQQVLPGQDIYHLGYPGRTYTTWVTRAEVPTVLPGLRYLRCYPGCTAPNVGYPGCTAPNVGYPGRGAS